LPLTQRDPLSLSHWRVDGDGGERAPQSPAPQRRSGIVSARAGRWSFRSQRVPERESATCRARRDGSTALVWRRDAGRGCDI